MLTRFVAGTAIGVPLGIGFVLLMGRTEFAIIPIAIGAIVGSAATTLATGIIDARRIRRYRRTMYNIQ